MSKDPLDPPTTTEPSAEELLDAVARQAIAAARALLDLSEAMLDDPQLRGIALRLLLPE